jgi:hypothetical protein
MVSDANSVVNFVVIFCSGVGWLFQAAIADDVLGRIKRLEKLLKEKDGGAK